MLLFHIILYLIVIFIDVIKYFFKRLFLIFLFRNKISTQNDCYSLNVEGRRLQKINLTQDNQNKMRQKYIYFFDRSQNFQKLTLQKSMRNTQNNPSFLENAQQNKLTESVRISGYKNNQSDLMHHLIPEHNGRAENQRIEEPSEKSQKIIEAERLQRQHDIKPIRTQYSQISGVETGFKKLKANQVEILKELRNQYEVLRNIQSEEGKQSKTARILSPSSSGYTLPRNEERASSRTPSIKSGEKVMDKEINYEQKLWHIERKQYEMVISNCQQKIQELLHSQMEYKKTIYQLKSIQQIKTNTSIQGVKDENYRELQKKERQSKEKCDLLENQLGRMKFMFKEQNDRNIKLEDEMILRDQEVNKLADQKRRLEDLLRLEKDKFMTNEIQKKKMQMEYEIMERDKTFQINRLLRQLEHRGAVAQQDLKITIRRQEQEIQMKDKRYSLLLEKLESKNKQIEDKEKQHKILQDQQYTKKEDDFSLEALKKIISEGTARTNHGNEQLMRAMTTILKTLDQNEGKQSRPTSHLQNQRLFGEIRLLKAQIESLRQSKNDSFNIEPIKKVYESQINNLKQNITILEQKLRNAKRSSLDSPRLVTQHSQGSSDKNYEVMKYTKKIQELEDLISSKQILLNEQEQYIRNYKLRQEKTELQIRALRRKADQTLFELQKNKKERQFSEKIIQREHEANLKIKCNEIQKANQGLKYWKLEFEKVKVFYENKIIQKNKIIEQMNDAAEVSNTEKNYQQNLQLIQKKYEKQLASLTEKLGNYQQLFLHSENLEKKCTRLENNLYDAQNNFKQAYQFTQKIDHLWGIKQAEYGNISGILQQAGFNIEETMENP